MFWTMRNIFTVCTIFVALPSALSSTEFSDLELRAYRDVKVLYDFAKDAVQGNSVLRYSPFGRKPGQGSTKLKGFVYTNCADPSQELVVVSNLSVSPDPVSIPGNITVSGGISVKSGFGAPVKVDLSIWKQVFGIWVKIPCIDEFGSCSYDDFCKIVHPSQCPPEFQKIGLHCNCPYTAGSWNVPPVTISIPESLPVKISGGVRARLEGSVQGKMLTCVEVTLDLA